MDPNGFKTFNDGITAPENGTGALRLVLRPELC